MKPCQQFSCALLLIMASAIACINAPAWGEPLRPPSVPLVACDPYFSIWSSADHLTDTDTVHWTGKPHRLASSLEIDNRLFRLMGTQPADAPPLPQTSVEVLPTRTIYTFAGAGIELTLTFLTPALPDDLEILARPVTYVSWQLRSSDGHSHSVHVRFAASAELAVNRPNQRVDAKVVRLGEQLAGLTAVKIGSTQQAILARKGDDVRIDWGYLYIAVPNSDSNAAVTIQPSEGDLPAAAEAVRGCVSFESFEVADEPVTHRLILAYDDLYSIRYMQRNLRPYWRRNGAEAADLLLASAREFQSLSERCEAFDKELMNDLARAGGDNYAALGALAYRQCFAAGKFVADEHGQPLQFCKENHSNGCIGTSDVFYPMSPQFLLFGPTLAKSFIVPFMNYAASERWRFPFAPHDLGQYPHANGQRYGGGEESEENQMPVEESGNLLILFAAIAQMEGNADFAGLYWPQLHRWAEYLKAKGFDPDNQLCTDDFAGHLAHNVNLSAKAICGLAAFGELCAMRGDADLAQEYSQLAKQFAQQWAKEADDGDHLRLAFDRPGTWSQKYNLVWDGILGWDLFPGPVRVKEMRYYQKVQNRYGLPLDNRQTYTKLDWILWTATLTQDRSDFEQLVDPVVRFLNETPDRVPMTDWYFTDTAKPAALQHAQLSAASSFACSTRKTSGTSTLSAKRQLLPTGLRCHNHQRQTQLPQSEGQGAAYLFVRFVARGDLLQAIPAEDRHCVRINTRSPSRTRKKRLRARSINCVSAISRAQLFEQFLWRNTHLPTGNINFLPPQALIALHRRGRKFAVQTFNDMVRLLVFGAPKFSITHMSN